MSEIVSKITSFPKKVLTKLKSLNWKQILLLVLALFTFMIPFILLNSYEKGTTGYNIGKWWLILYGALLGLIVLVIVLIDRYARKNNFQEMKLSSLSEPQMSLFENWLKTAKSRDIPEINENCFNLVTDFDLKKDNKPVTTCQNWALNPINRHKVAERGHDVLYYSEFIVDPVGFAIAAIIAIPIVVDSVEFAINLYFDMSVWYIYKELYD